MTRPPDPPVDIIDRAIRRGMLAAFILTTTGILAGLALPAILGALAGGGCVIAALLLARRLAHRASGHLQPLDLPAGPVRQALDLPAGPVGLGWYVPPGVDRCPRCGDTNYDELTRLCLTCTHPQHPLSQAYWQETQFAANRDSSGTDSPNHR